jgi:hypothetical protein
MSEPEKPATGRGEPGQKDAQGPNLKLLYGLVVLALAAAMAIAAMIVRPFYLRQ